LLGLKRLWKGCLLIVLFCSTDGDRTMKMKYLALPFLLATFSSPVFANDCSITVNATDAMQYDTKAINVKNSCKDFTVNLKHAGTLPKTAMGHNWVLSKAEDKQGITADGVAAGLDNNYLKPGDTRVIAATKIIGGGESTSVSFPVSKLKAGTAYSFFCSFPGHNAVMQGSVNLVP